MIKRTSLKKMGITNGELNVNKAVTYYLEAIIRDISETLSRAIGSDEATTKDIQLIIDDLAILNTLYQAHITNNPAYLH